VHTSQTLPPSRCCNSKSRFSHNAIQHQKPHYYSSSWRLSPTLPLHFLNSIHRSFETLLEELPPTLTLQPLPLRAWPFVILLANQISSYSVTSTQRIHPLHSSTEIGSSSHVHLNCTTYRGSGANSMFGASENAILGGHARWIEIDIGGGEFHAFVVGTWFH